MPPVHHAKPYSRPRHRLVTYPEYTSDEVDYDTEGNPQPVECPPGMIDKRFGTERLYAIDKTGVKAISGKSRMSFGCTSTPLSIYWYLQHYGIKYGFSTKEGKCKVNIPAPWNIRLIYFGTMGYVPHLVGRWVALEQGVANAIATAMELETSQYESVPLYSHGQGELVTGYRFVPTKISGHDVMNHLTQITMSAPFINELKEN